MGTGDLSDADALAASLRLLEQALDGARAAATQAQEAGRRQHGTLLVREQELAAARSEAAGAADAVTKLQLELGGARASVEALARGLEAEQARLTATQAAVESEQAAAATALAQLADARAAHGRDREQLELRVATLRAEIDSTVTALHEQLEQERAQHRARVGALGLQLGELGSGLQSVRRRLEEEQAQRARTDVAAERVLTAASALLDRERARAQERQGAREPEAPPAEPADAVEAAAEDPPTPVSELRWPRAAPPYRPGSARSPELEGLLTRFDEIRAQLAEQGLGTPPSPPPAGDQRG
jgi:chromosome segregation ATPase